MSPKEEEDMANTTIVIQTVTGEPWVETSPRDPTTGTLTATAATTLVSTDTGPWTVSFPGAGTQAAVTAPVGGAVSLAGFTVTLQEVGSDFTVQVQEDIKQTGQARSSGGRAAGGRGGGGGRRGGR
jgi:hypothetical protein